MSYDSAVIRALWQRDMTRFLRQPSRIVGALGQPLIFWLVIGSGLAATFRIPGTPVDYMEFFYPGVVMMVLVFASIFAAISVIDDRHQGFLQAVLTSPASRGALVTGKCLGSMSVALAQVALFLALAPLAGFSLGYIQWLALLVLLGAASFALTAVGFAVAWWLDNTQAYHAIQMILLVPLWVLSGAMFPPDRSHALFYAVMHANPIAYGVTGARHALYGGRAPEALGLPISLSTAVAVTLAFAAGAWALAVFVCKRRS